ncbi:MAG: hypothetical protein QGH23_07265 [Dehalococcoidia bacterium]|nr:hypothetical protein [Dehalococcoidia bacterium]MDP6510987.1 hypothetical protein [Dehalococcoidia bacterium]MDP6783309.1 hypothetical protein [Dehalococcoidia bacterium]
MSVIGCATGTIAGPAGAAFGADLAGAGAAVGAGFAGAGAAVGAGAGAGVSDLHATADTTIVSATSSISRLRQLPPSFIIAPP